MIRTILILSMSALHIISGDHDGSSDPLDWLRESIPGEPGVDYPILDEIQDTSFSCAGKRFGGYYADQEMRCQGYHVCLTPERSPTDRKTSFLCPNGTIFSQKLFTCDWWFNVDCNEADGFYSLNEKIGDSEAVLGDEGFGARQSQGQKTASTQSGENGKLPTSINQNSGKNEKPISGASVTQSPRNPIASSQETFQESDEQNNQKEIGGSKQNAGSTAPSRPVEQVQSSSFEDENGQEEVSSEDLLTYNENNVREQGKKNGGGTQRPTGKQNKSGESKEVGRGPPKQKGQVSKPDARIPSQQNEDEVQSGEEEEQNGFEPPLPAYGVGSSSVLGSKSVGQNGGQSKPATESFDQKFDLVQYDATIPDSLESDQEVPVLLADPFAGSEEVDSSEVRKEVPGKPKIRPNTSNQSIEPPNFLYDPPKRA